MCLYKVTTLIATKAELEALRASLPTPRVSLQLTPSGMTEAYVHKTLYQQQLNAIRAQEASLTAAQQNLHKALDELRQETGLQHDFTQATHTVACNYQL